MLADELENELGARPSATRTCQQLSDDWRIYATQLREAAEHRELLSPGLRRALVLPESLEEPRARARVFEDAAEALSDAIGLRRRH